MKTSFEARKEAKLKGL